MTTSRRPVGIAVLGALVAGTLGWIGLWAIALQLGSAAPSNLGFDLELLLAAGRNVAAGQSPYALELIGGNAPTATHLFYSYPPPVAQALAVFASVPSVVGLIGLGVIAICGLLIVTEALRRRYASGASRLPVLAVTAAAAPLTLPFAVGLLFGNFDVLFPLLYGTMLLAALVPRGAVGVAGGAALVVASLKIHPASIGAWFLVRAIRERRDGRPAPSVRVLAAAVGIGIAVVVLSLAFGGTRAWEEYAQVIGAGTRAVIVDPRNAGIAALLAALVGEGDGLARNLHIGVGIGAIVVTIWAAWSREDTLESFAWATAASLVTLPVTWYHYPSAMIPIAIAASLRAHGPAVRPVRLLLVAAGVVAAISIAALPLVYVAIGLVIAAARRSGHGEPAETPSADPLAPAAPVPSPAPRDRRATG